ncbi:AAA domain-containing protein [Macellibacteroides fermentans]|uniref:Superfamily I DNA and/or RNA helicase n=1 Tax=Parabacteroides chartae TaxID=1037355 RepID=A0A1T5C920_9BACT|nr:AAA domain-containing protein [Parabacteroides chartae]SKB55924.1 Protein of unknown function [Parabacteroides chartae]
MIDSAENLILIDKKVRTLDIESCLYDNNTNRYNIVFQGNSKCYSYSRDRVVWLKHPVKVDPNFYRLIHDGNNLSNIETILIFSNTRHTYYHIRLKNGMVIDCNKSNLLITKSCLEGPVAKNVFDYLKQVASENPLSDEEGRKLLVNKYREIDFIADDTAIAHYLDPQKFRIQKKSTNTLIYPFSCNASQIKAVQSAFENQISVIQGPPGTGKTQTILNIIANILKSGKTVQVVSNNNSAIQNVLEKLSKYDMGFMVALLGKKENKQDFIESQTIEKQYPENIATWKNDNAGKQAFVDEIRRQTEQLSILFAKQERLANARQELQVLELEWQHYKQEFGYNEPTIKLRRNVHSSQLLQLWNECQFFADTRDLFNSFNIKGIIQRLKWFIFKLKSRVIYEISNKKFYKRDIAVIISEFHILFYKTKQTELAREIEGLDKYLATKDAEKQAKNLSDISMEYLKNILYRKYGTNRTKLIFSLDDLKSKSEKVLEEYPIILSTTFSSRSSLNPGAMYDYLIIDEASQVSIETGALALSCAKNVVIVGDSSQLPNVVTEKDKIRLSLIAQKFNVAEGYDCANNSFLQSICKIIPNVPQTLLREHYRCHPKIINFCNQKFYGGNLLIMTRDQGEDDVICVIKTVGGNHSRDRMNQREIDVIINEVIPTLPYKAEEIGIIAPYNNQTNAIQKTIWENIDVATVHKFQGREKDAIIMTTVDDIITPFSDNPNLLNVAVSRAKQKFYLVVSGNEHPMNGNISDLISYIEYNNCTATSSKIHSIFDYLYKQYTDTRIAYLRKRKKISVYDSENLTYALIVDILHNNVCMQHLDVICHLPLAMLICDFSQLNDEERKYAQNDKTHIDFMIYNRVVKRHILAIETDGYAFHKPGTKQFERDKKKDRILSLYEIPLIRLSTTGSNERKIIEDKLSEIIGRY